MTRRGDIPTQTRARRVTDQYLAQCSEAGRSPSVLALAGQLGLTNTTFRRHFPDLTTEISTARTCPDVPAGTQKQPSAHEVLVIRNSKLQRANRSLTDNLRFAVANIQRLALDNARLREALEANANVTRIDRPGRSR